MSNKLSVVVICLAFILILPILFKEPVKATGLSYVSNELARINESVTSKHTIYFVTTNGVSSGQTIVLNYPSSAFVFGASYDYTDMTLAEGSTSDCTSSTFSNKTLGASPSGATWGATYSSNTITLTSGTGTITANRCVRIELNSNGGAHSLTNPSVTSNTVYNIDITVGTLDSGELAVIILNDTTTPDTDEVEIRVEVESVLSFDVDVSVSNCNNNTETNASQNKISFGTLTPGTHKVSNASINYICIDAVSNSTNGIYIYTQSARANTVGGLTTTSGGVITSQTADLTSVGVQSGYGIRVSSTGTPQFGSFSVNSPFNNGSVANVGQIPGQSASPSVLVNSTAPAGTGTSSRIAVEVAVKASTSTPSGRYTDTITFTAVPNF